MKRSGLLSILLALPIMLAAQSTVPTASVTQQANGPGNLAGLLFAANFGHWTISPTPQGNRWTSPGQCFGTSGGITFPLFSTSAPITIVDLGTPSNTETVTPTLASYNVGGCSVSLPAANAHSNYYLQSGTLGLQEALNFAGAGHFVVVLTPDWQTMGGTTAMITSAKGTTSIGIFDERSSVIPYVWGGSAYASLPFAGGSSSTCSSSASPAVCAAAAAGSVVVAASGTTVVVDTTAVTANSQIFVQEDASLGTKLSVTCNATAATAPPTISARTAATSFTITTTAPTTNPRCFSYVVIN